MELCIALSLFISLISCIHFTGGWIIHGVSARDSLLHRANLTAGQLNWIQHDCGRQAGQRASLYKETSSIQFVLERKHWWITLDLSSFTCGYNLGVPIPKYPHYLAYCRPNCWTIQYGVICPNKP